MDVTTDVGVARLTWHARPPRAPAALLLLGHGAGGGITVPDLRRVAQLAASCDVAVGLVEQPYRVAGRRAPAPAGQLDSAFAAVAQAAGARLRRRIGATGSVPLIVGGRSSGARVACRTARSVGAAGVLALAFPLQPPRRKSGPAPSRLPELLAAGVPVLVVQGERDSFGTAADVRAALAAADGKGAPEICVAPAAGADHGLRKGIDETIVRNWLKRFLP